MIQLKAPPSLCAAVLRALRQAPAAVHCNVQVAVIDASLQLTRRVDLLAAISSAKLLSGHGSGLDAAPRHAGAPQRSPRRRTRRQRARAVRRRRGTRCVRLRRWHPVVGGVHAEPRHTGDLVHERPLVRVALQQPLDEPADLDGEAPLELGPAEEDGPHIRLAEGQVAAEHAVQHDATAPNIAALVVRPAPENLRRDETLRPALRLHARASWLEAGGESEIDDLEAVLAQSHPTPLQDDVFQLEIPVGDAARVHVGHRAHYLAESRSSLRLGDGPTLLDFVDEVPPGAQLHRHVHKAILPKALEELNDIWVVHLPVG
mmetsp:Transcript_75327/g.218784  ORF Transcript_75327/g.218784 Transcript_75327/m.218784 type:complete len:317 (+) Transcript_75327:135-1085(+)